MHGHVCVEKLGHFSRVYFGTTRRAASAPRRLLARVPTCLRWTRRLTCPAEGAFRPRGRQRPIGRRRLYTASRAPPPAPGHGAAHRRASAGGGRGGNAGERAAITNRATSADAAHAPPRRARDAAPRGGAVRGGAGMQRP